MNGTRDSPLFEKKKSSNYEILNLIVPNTVCPTVFIVDGNATDAEKKHFM